MKIFDKWKQEWWIKNASDLAKEYLEKSKELTEKFEAEIKIQTSKNEAMIEKLQIAGEALEYKLKVLEERKIEAQEKDNDLRLQIKLLEAKASPSVVWAEAFTQGMSKAWDLMLPVIQENVDKVKQAIHDKAITETLARLNGNNKKNY